MSEEKHSEAEYGGTVANVSSVSAIVRFSSYLTVKIRGNATVSRPCSIGSTANFSACGRSFASRLTTYSLGECPPSS